MRKKGRTRKEQKNDRRTAHDGMECHVSVSGEAARRFIRKAYTNIDNKPIMAAGITGEPGTQGASAPMPLKEAKDTMLLKETKDIYKKAMAAGRVDIADKIPENVKRRLSLESMTVQEYIEKRMDYGRTGQK